MRLVRLEAEVLQLIAALGGNASLEMQGFRVRPEHFIGLEINKQAVAIAQLVLWIGYFQWQHKTTGKADTGDRPLLPKTQTIRQQDAVLAYDEKIPRRDVAPKWATCIVLHQFVAERPTTPRPLSTTFCDERPPAGRFNDVSYIVDCLTKYAKSATRRSLVR